MVETPLVRESVDAWRSQAQLIEIEKLLTVNSPRSCGTDPEHVKRLAEIETGLPPVIVRKGTLQVIDGAHRIEAAKLKGRKRILAIFFDGTDAEALILAIEANTRHGLPLSLSDRKRAAQQLLALMPDLSDRAIGAKTGLAPGTVRAVRTRSTAQDDQSAVRIGRDGRARPVNSTAARERIAGMLAEHPDASAVQIAEAAGASARLVRTVRNELAVKSAARSAAPPGERPDRPRAETPPEPSVNSATLKAEDLIARLLSDPVVQVTPGGRHFVEWLRRHALGIDEIRSDLGWLPVECQADVLLIARQSACAWQALAGLLGSSQALQRQGLTGRGY